MVAFAIFTGAHLFFNFDFKHRFWKFSILVLTVFLCLFLHLLSVRSGILGFYLSGLFIGLREVFIRKRKNLFVTGVILLAFSLTSFQVFPSFQKKFYITCRSVSSLVQKQDIKNLSDSGRVKSIEAGLRLGISDFWTGVGAGDVKSEMVNYYQDHCPELTAKKILPHNQFVFVFAASGLFGLIWFCFVVLYPIFYYRWWNNNLMMSFNIILLSSFLSDHTLETQTGVGFYLVFQLLLIQLSKIQKANPENEANVLPSFLDSMI
jgi:O-antigen ligase